MSFGFGSIVSETSSQSLGWSGKEVEVLLQALTAHVKKLSVRTFILTRSEVLVVNRKKVLICFLQRCELFLRGLRLD